MRQNWDVFQVDAHPEDDGGEGSDMNYLADVILGYQNIQYQFKKITYFVQRRFDVNPNLPHQHRAVLDQDRGYQHHDGGLAPGIQRGIYDKAFFIFNQQIQKFQDKYFSFYHEFCDKEYLEFEQAQCDNQIFCCQKLIQFIISKLIQKICKDDLKLLSILIRLFESYYNRQYFINYNKMCIIIQRIFDQIIKRNPFYKEQLPSILIINNFDKQTLDGIKQSSNEQFINILLKKQHFIEIRNIDDKINDLLIIGTLFSHAFIVNNKKIKGFVRFIHQHYMQDNNLINDNFQNCQDNEIQQKIIQQQIRKKNKQDFKCDFKFNKQEPKDIQKKLLQNDECYIFFDIETTTGLDIQMKTYLLSYCIVGDISVKEKDLQVNSIYINEQNTSEKDIFFKFFEEIQKQLERFDKIKVYSWNGAKFDTIFIAKYVFQYFQKNTISIFGNQNNIKILQIQQKIFFCDAMIASVGRCSLDSFCQSMGIESKIQQENDISVKDLMLSVNDYQKFLKFGEIRQKVLIKYCEQDVRCMTLAFIKFNNILCMAIDQIKNKDIPAMELEQQKKLILKYTIPELSFKIITSYIVDKEHELYTLNISEQFQNFRKNYRGGITQCFTQDVFQKQDNFKIQYVDVNSLYPFIMSNYQFCSRYLPIIQINQNLKINKNLFNEFDFVQIKSFNLPEKIYQYGYFGVKHKQQTLYLQKEDNLDDHYVFWFEIQQLIQIYQEYFKTEDFDQSIIQLGDNAYISCNQQDIQIYQAIVQDFKKFKMNYQSELNNQSCLKYFEDIKKIYNIRVSYKSTNPQLAQALKIIMNSCYGQLGMKVFPLTFYINQQDIENFNLICSEISKDDQQFINQMDDQIIKYIHDRIICSEQSVGKGKGKSQWFIPQNYYIENIQHIEEFQCIKVQLKHKFEDEFLTSLPKPRLVHIASQITARSRTYMLKYLYKISQEGHQILYMDTDSLVINENLNLKHIKDIKSTEFNDRSIIDNKELGLFKYEYDNIVRFRAFGAKLYSFGLANDDDIMKSYYKIKGVQLKQYKQGEQQIEEDDESIQNIQNLFKNLENKLDNLIEQQQKCTIGGQQQFQKRNGVIKVILQEKQVDLNIKRDYKKNVPLIDYQHYLQLNQ